VVLGFDLKMADEDDFGASEASPSRPRPSSKPESKPEEKKAQPEPGPEPEDEETREKKKRKAEAVKEKEEGNAAYKKKEFDSAIEHYTKAMELDEDDIAYLTNRAAVYLEMGKVSFSSRLCDLVDDTSCCSGWPSCSVPSWNEKGKLPQYVHATFAVRSSSFYAHNATRIL
jgi:tetratricopeptide (TPR) repeat protein